MNTVAYVRTQLAGALGALALCATGIAHAHSGEPGAAIAYEWNELMQTTTPASAGPFGGRFFALVHLAQFEAVNSIERRYEPYLGSIRASRGASAEAAAAQAAHDVAVALVPAQQALYDAALATDLAGINGARAAAGIAVGRAAAQQVLAWAAADGFNVPDTPFALPLQAGAWRPVPAAAAFTRSLNMRPMAVTSRSQFLPKRPPDLYTPEYAAALNELKSVGGAVSSVRTADQTRLARLWAGAITRTSSFAVWNATALQLSSARALGLLDATRVLTLMNVATFDGLLTTQSSKYVFGLWRPQTAIQNADNDFNDATTGDATWTSLVGIPPYPSYPGNMACIGAAAARSLQISFGTDTAAITVQWKGNTVNGVTNPDVTQQYTSLAALAQDQADARVYGGLHFRFDNEASQQICPRIAEWVHANYLASKHDRGRDDGRGERDDD
jgi:hypothetical protein